MMTVPAPQPASVAPIDRAHLKEMTLGDDALAREVLTLFDSQAAAIIETMRGVDQEARVAMAHALKGAARGIGAWQVAAASECIDHGAGEAALAALAAAVAQARAEIAQILRQG
jgi:hypothetical protein